MNAARELNVRTSASAGSAKHSNVKSSKHLWSFTATSSGVRQWSLHRERWREKAAYITGELPSC